MSTAPSIVTFRTHRDSCVALSASLAPQVCPRAVAQEVVAVYEATYT
jgi:hypothetical protein